MKTMIPFFRRNIKRAQEGVAEYRKDLSLPEHMSKASEELNEKLALTELMMSLGGAQLGLIERVELLKSQGANVDKYQKLLEGLEEAILEIEGDLKELNNPSEIKKVNSVVKAQEKMLAQMEEVVKASNK